MVYQKRVQNLSEKVVNNFQKSSILDFWRGSEYASAYRIFSNRSRPQIQAAGKMKNS